MYRHSAWPRYEQRSMANDDDDRKSLAGGGAAGGRNESDDEGRDGGVNDDDDGASMQHLPSSEHDDGSERKILFLAEDGELDPAEKRRKLDKYEPFYRDDDDDDEDHAETGSLKRSKKNLNDKLQTLPDGVKQWLQDVIDIKTTRSDKTKLLQSTNRFLLEPHGYRIPRTIDSVINMMTTVEEEVGFTRIYYCPNQCILYRGRFGYHDRCPKCGKERSYCKNLTSLC